MAKGGKRAGAGRKPGSLSSWTQTTKELVEGAFENIGGADAFAKWAKENPTDFYTKVFTKLIPKNIQLDATVTTLEDSLQRVWEETKANERDSGKRVSQSSSSGQTLQ